MQKINFFTIVFDGMPFIKHHINEFNKLECDWHWHIVEGLSNLVNDTAWSLSLGADISKIKHNNFLSTDGTTEYIDKLIKQYPDKISIYRPLNRMWNGKTEMCNVPLKNINEDCILFQIDVDELWLADDILKVNNLLSTGQYDNAYFYCYYFIGNRYVISENTYGTGYTHWNRAWNYKIGDIWQRHEPPCLIPHKIKIADVYLTKSLGITFQHFAYSTEASVKFKEYYYGYKDAIKQWKLMNDISGEINAADYLNWIKPFSSICILSDWDQSKPILYKK